MAYLIGTDEAGYGPNLGPLVISASVWQVPEGTRIEDLYGLLEGAVVPLPERAGANGTRRIAMADSKLLYQPGKGLRHLERGVLAAMTALGRRPATWREVWSGLAPDSTAERDTIPWYSGYDPPVSAGEDAAERESAAAGLTTTLAAAGVCLVDLRSRVVFEESFNRLVDRYGSKGEMLSHCTLELAAEMAASLEGPVTVVCDKHGGRNRYGRLLSEHFPDWLVEVYGETRDLSLYRFGPADGRVEIRFCTRAESTLPAALASMASKYLRELAMEALNDYWCARVPGLIRTAGYPGDARRFKAAIAAAQADLKIDDRSLWRSR